MRDLILDFRRGGGSVPEVVHGIVRIWGTEVRPNGPSVVVTTETTLKLSDGKATLANAQTSGTGPLYEWAYIIQVEPFCGRNYRFYVAIPDGTGPVNLIDLPKLNPITGEGFYLDLKEWLELYGGLPDKVDMLEDNQGVIQNDVADLKVLGGLASGDVNDATTANLIETEGTQTKSALSAAFASKHHTHDIEDVTGLQAALDDKTDSGHTHGAATSAADGFMSSEDKTKLDGQASEMIAAISAEVVRADAAYRPATNQLFEGASLYAYGHSWVMDSNPYISPGGEYQKRVKERLQLGTVAQNGLSGAYMLDMAAGVLAPSVAGKDRRFPMGGKGIVTLQCLINDIVTGNAIPSDATWLPFYKDNLRTFLAAVTAGKIQDASTGVYAVGTWADLSAGTADWYPAGKVKYVANATSLGATAKWDVSGDVAWVNAVAVATTTGATNGGNWTARVNGVVVGSYQPRGKKPDTVVTGTRGTWGDSPMAVKLTGLNAAAGTSGNKTITITCDEARTTYVAGVMEPSANPPKVFVVLEAPRNPAASNVSGWNTYAATYRQAIIDVVAEFPSAFTVDIAPGWQNPTFIGSKDTAKAHPNDLGMIHIADKLESAIRANITAPDPGVLVL